MRLRRALRKSIRNELIELRHDYPHMEHDDFAELAKKTIVDRYKEFYEDLIYNEDDPSEDEELYAEIDWEELFKTIIKIVEELLPLILLLIG